MVYSAKRRRKKSVHIDILYNKHSFTNSANGLSPKSMPSFFGGYWKFSP